jgi:hypothetical protein
VNVITLYVILRRRIGPFLNPEFYRSISKVVVSSLAMWAAIALAGLIFPWRNSAPITERLLILSLEIALGLAIFLWLSHLFKSSELRMAVEMARRKLARRPH